MRAYFAGGVEKMHIPWAVEGLPVLLHLSLFLFFSGLIVFLFNVNQEVFIAAATWIGLFSMLYALITLLPLIRQDSPYYAPLSTPAWFLYAGLQYVTFKALAFITSDSHYRRSRNRHREWMLGGADMKVEKALSKKSSDIDIDILGWTIKTLGEDDSLEDFFVSIPGLFKSKLVKHLERDFPEVLLNTFWHAMDGLMDRTLSSNSVTESVKSRRIVLCRDIISTVPCPYNFLDDNLSSHFDQAPVSIERLQAMARWYTHKKVYVADSARARVARNLANMQERGDDWIRLASDVCGLAADDLRDNIAHGGDNVLLATLINVSRRSYQSDDSELELNRGPMAALTEFDIRHTLPGLQHDFCKLWNDLIQVARNRVNQSYTPIYILNEIRHLYAALHQGTGAAPTAFSPSIDSVDSVLDQLSTYPLCQIASHHPNSTPYLYITHPRVVSSTRSTLPSDSSSSLSILSDSTVSLQVKVATAIAGATSSSYPAALAKIGDSSRGRPTATSSALPAHPSPRLTDASPAGTVAGALLGIPPTATLSHTLEGTTQQDIVAPCAAPDITASMPEPTPPSLDTSLASSDRGADLTPNPLLPTLSAVVFSTPSPPVPSRVLPLHNAEFLAILSGTHPSRPTGNAALPRLHARGLMNAGSMCLADAVLQLLVHSPPFWNLFNELGDLKRQCGTAGPEIGGGTTPLVDATLRFFEDFTTREKKLPSTQQPPQQASGERQRDEEEKGKEEKVVDSFEQTYMYDAMKEKKQLKDLLVRSSTR
jgi:hypothetical protein